MTPKLIFTVARWIAALVLLFFAYRRATGIETPAEGVALNIPGLVVGIGLLIAAVACIAPELVEWISMPFRAIFDAIFFPGTRETPPPDYNLARLYREQERHEEALEAYFRILHHHPQELLAYLEGIETAFDCGEPEKGAKLLEMGLRDLPAEGLREQVQRAYDRCINPPPATDEYGEEPEATEPEEIAPVRETDPAEGP